jgi:CHAD domain-containing protein
LRLVGADGEPSEAALKSNGETLSVKAAKVKMDEHASMDEAIETVLTSCLEQFVGNWPALRASNDIESVHQMRVALRRMRAALSLFRRAVPCADFETAAARAKSVAATLGVAREWDVFRESLDAGPREKLSGEPSFYALIDVAELRRARAYEAARHLIAGRTTRQFVNDLRRALKRKAWRDGTDAATADAPVSAREFAVEALDRLHARSLKKCKGLAGLDPEQRHQARISLKKLRYAAEFFEDLFDGKEDSHAYMRTLSKVQNGLGADNDLTTARRLLEEIEADGGEKTAFARGFVLGWLLHEQEKLPHSKTGEKAVRKLEPFWR